MFLAPSLTLDCSCILHFGTEGDNIDNDCLIIRQLLRPHSTNNISSSSNNLQQLIEESNLQSGYKDRKHPCQEC